MEIRTCLRFAQTLSVRRFSSCSGIFQQHFHSPRSEHQFNSPCSNKITKSFKGHEKKFYNQRLNLVKYVHSGFPCCCKENLSSSGASEVKFAQTCDFMEASDTDTASVMNRDMLIYEDFISEEEENSILEEIEPYMKRMRYEFNHWDDAIHGFRETERGRWREKNKEIIQRVRVTAFPPGVSQLSSVHILDLAKDGYIKPHVDAVRFCGNTIAGISLLSSAVMRLVHTENKNKSADFILKPRSLYIMKDEARYMYTHEVLAESDSKFRGEVIPRERRISIMCRNEPKAEDAA